MWHDDGHKRGTRAGRVERSLGRGRAPAPTGDSRGDLQITACAIRAAIPDVNRGPFACDPPGLMAARGVVETSELLLVLVDDLRKEGLSGANSGSSHG